MSSRLSAHDGVRVPVRGRTPVRERSAGAASAGAAGRACGRERRRARSRRARGGGLPAAATSGTALAGVAAGWSVLTVVFSVAFRPAECVDAHGFTGFVAANIAQMRSVAECPTGTLGYGPHTVAVVAAASALLAAALIGQVAAGLAGYWIGRAARAIHRLVMSLARPLPSMPGPWGPRARHAVQAWWHTSVVPPFPIHGQWRRGPPVVV